MRDGELDVPRCGAPRNGFRRSSYSGQNGHCVEVAGSGGGGRWVRDSKAPGTGLHRFTAGQWRSFLAHLKAGGLDPR